MSTYGNFKEYCEQRKLQEEVKELEDLGKRTPISKLRVRPTDASKAASYALGHQPTPIPEPSNIENPSTNHWTHGGSQRPVFDRPYEPQYYEPEPESETKPEVSKRRSKPDNSSFTRTQRTINPSKEKYNQYQPTASEIEEIIKLGKEGHQPLGISYELQGGAGHIIPVHAIAAILKQYGIENSGDEFSIAAHEEPPVIEPKDNDLSKDWGKWRSGKGGSYEILQDALRAQREKEKRPFGYTKDEKIGVKTGDKRSNLYNQLVSHNMKSDVSFDQLKGSKELVDKIRDLAYDNHTPLGISMILADDSPPGIGMKIRPADIEKLLGSGDPLSANDSIPMAQLAKKEPIAKQRKGLFSRFFRR